MCIESLAAGLPYRYPSKSIVAGTMSNKCTVRLRYIFMGYVTHKVHNKEGAKVNGRPLLTPPTSSVAHLLMCRR